eukprot:s66_g34.t2
MAQRERRNYKTAEREEREKRRKWRKERRERAKEDDTWSLAQWLMAGFGILCCREVSHGSKEHISDAKRRKEKERRARRKEGKQRERGDDRRHQRHPKDVEDLGRVKGAPDEVEMEHNADFLRRRSSSRLLDDDSEYSGESARSGLSRASSFASSYASSYVSTQSAEPRRRRSQGSRRGSKGREGPGEAAPSTVKVLNLADLRGRELPAKLEDLQKVPMDPAHARTSVKNGASAANGSSSNRQPAKPSPPPVEVPPREEQEEVQAPLSARSGRSEGAGSVKSVASTSIQEAKAREGGRVSQATRSTRRPEDEGIAQATQVEFPTAVVQSSNILKSRSQDLATLSGRRKLEKEVASRRQPDPHEDAKKPASPRPHEWNFTRPWFTRAAA